MSEFFAMGGYGGYVWSCYGLTLVVLAGNLWFSRRELKAQIQRATRRTQVAADAMTPRQRRMSLVAVALLAVGGAVGFALQAFQDNVQYFFSPSDVERRQGAARVARFVLAAW